MRFLQPVILSTILFLLLLLAVMGRNLWVGLETLSTAGDENAQWTIQQLDTEIATLYATLLEQRGAAEPDARRIRLRTDIALSRIAIVGRGNAREILSSVPEADPLLDALERYSARLAQIVDGADALGPAEIDQMIALTADVRPDAKALALLGIAEGAARTEAARSAFRDKLQTFGTVAIVVIGLLTLTLVALNWLLTVARRQSAALRLSSARLRSTVSASLDAVFVTDEAGRIIDMNPAAEEIFGHRRVAVIGRDFTTTFLPSVPGAAGLAAAQGDPHDTTARVVSSGRIDVTATRAWGETFPAEMNVAMVTGDGHRINVIYLRDISERKLSEERLIEAKERAERTDQAKSQFLTVMSHEMRTPLNGILGVLDLLRGTALSDRQRRYIDIASGSGDVLLRLINDALDITRIEAGAIALNPGRINLETVIGRVVEGLEPLAREKGIDIGFDSDPKMAGDYLGDGTRIRQIVTNLVGNAIKFTEDSRIEIRLEGEEMEGTVRAAISVRDTGPGISEDHLDMIFDDYVAIAKSAGRQERGDGLGLAISRKIARMMGGDLTVRSIEGDGSVFTLTLPLDPAPAQAAPEAAEPGTQGGRRILIVDDNALNRSVLKEMLAGTPGRVDEAIDGREAIRLAESTAYDLIIMDINMPDLDGLEATCRIRASDGPNRATHIQGLTAYGEDEFREKAHLAGMNGLSGKPIRLAALEHLLAGLDLPPAPPAQRTGLINAEVFTEMTEALGPDLTAERSGLFFDEAGTALDAMIDGSAPIDADDAARRLHRIRGGAALFGFSRIGTALATASGHLKAARPDPFRNALIDARAALQETAQEVQALGLAPESGVSEADTASR